MGAQKLEAGDTTAPRFAAAPTKTAEVFDLDSHARAREAALSAYKRIKSAG